MLSDSWTTFRQLSVGWMPNELIIQIFETFELHELITLSQVCVAWRAVAFSQLSFASRTLEVGSNDSGMTFGNQAKNSVRGLNELFLESNKKLFRAVRSFKSSPSSQPQHIQLALKFLPNLSSIKLPHSGLSSRALSSIIVAFSSTLVSIDLSGNRSVNDAILGLIGKCKGVRSLDLSSCMNFSSESLSTLIRQRNFSQLIMQKLYNLTEADLSTIFDALTDNPHNFRFIDFSFNHHLVTLSALERLCALLGATGEKVLLNVSNCEQLVRRDVEKLEKRYPHTSIMHNTVLYDYSVDSIKTYLDFLLAN